MVEVHVATQAISGIDILHLIGLGYVLAIVLVVCFIQGAHKANR